VWLWCKGVDLLAPDLYVGGLGSVGVSGGGEVVDIWGVLVLSSGLCSWPWCVSEHE
jgi:hypothetical protein